MDLNPLFTGATLFRPAGASGGELKLFEQANIKLVHGWLVDPESPEFHVLSRTKDYDSSVNLIVEADHVAKGRLVVADDSHSNYVEEAPAGRSSAAGSSSATGSSSAGASRSGSSSAYRPSTGLSSEDRQKVEDGACTAITFFAQHTSHHPQPSSFAASLTVPNLN